MSNFSVLLSYPVAVNVDDNNKCEMPRKTKTKEPVRVVIVRDAQVNCEFKQWSLCTNISHSVGASGTHNLGHTNLPY
jgi:hypothetical protein